MFILAVGIGLIFFYVVAQKTIDSSSQERMKTNVARQSEHLRTILNIHYSYLEGVAEKIAESNELMNEENKEVLTVFQKNTSLDRLALIDPEGNAYYDNGVEKNVSHRRYFKEGISGNRTLSDPLESSVDQETVVLLSHKKADSYIHIDVEFGEGEGKIPVDSIAKRAEAYKPKEKVTYKMIKEYIEAKYGFKVHTAYIAEVKRDLGLPMYDAPNAVEELKQPRKHPTPEKVEAIKDALRYFAVI